MVPKIPQYHHIQITTRASKPHHPQHPQLFPLFPPTKVRDLSWVWPPPAPCSAWCCADIGSSGCPNRWSTWPHMAMGIGEFHQQNAGCFKCWSGVQRWFYIVSYIYIPMTSKCCIFLAVSPNTYFFRQTAIIIVFCSELDFDGILETCKYQRKCTRVNHI